MIPLVQQLLLCSQHRHQHPHGRPAPGRVVRLREQRHQGHLLGRQRHDRLRRRQRRQPRRVRQHRLQGYPHQRPVLVLQARLGQRQEQRHLKRWPEAELLRCP